LYKVLNSWKAEDTSGLEKSISRHLKNMRNVKVDHDSFWKSNCDIEEITIHANHLACVITNIRFYSLIINVEQFGWKT